MFPSTYKKCLEIYLAFLTGQIEDIELSEDGVYKEIKLPPTYRQGQITTFNYLKNIIQLSNKLS